MDIKCLHSPVKTAGICEKIKLKKLNKGKSYENIYNFKIKNNNLYNAIENQSDTFQRKKDKKKIV